jgi:hypothetical protein
MLCASHLAFEAGVVALPIAQVLSFVQVPTELFCGTSNVGDSVHDDPLGPSWQPNCPDGQTVTGLACGPSWHP